MQGDSTLDDFIDLCNYGSCLQEKEHKFYAEHLSKQLLQEITVSGFANALQRIVLNKKVSKDFGPMLSAIEVYKFHLAKSVKEVFDIIRNTPNLYELKWFTGPCEYVRDIKVKWRVQEALDLPYIKLEGETLLQ